MVSQEILAELSRIIGDDLAKNNFELVEFKHRYEGSDLVLRLLVDRPEGGITMDECARLNRSLGELLDEKDMVPVRYVLEVSSPGLDRPLISRKDFTRCLNKQAVFFLNEQINGKLELQGRITSAGDRSVFIDDAGQALEVPLTKINKAKLII